MFAVTMPLCLTGPLPDGGADQVPDAVSDAQLQRSAND